MTHALRRHTHRQDTQYRNLIQEIMKKNLNGVTWAHVTRLNFFFIISWIKFLYCVSCLCVYRLNVCAISVALSSLCLYRLCVCVVSLCVCVVSVSVLSLCVYRLCVFVVSVRVSSLCVSHHFVCVVCLCVCRLCLLAIYNFFIVSWMKFPYCVSNRWKQ